MPNRAEAIAAWTIHYEANPQAARARLQHMAKHGTPNGHIAERVGAGLALTPHQYRCEHWGDTRNCVQCLTEQWAAEAEAKRQDRRAASEGDGRHADDHQPKTAGQLAGSERRAPGSLR
jgi:hypothetical protein